jgi:hypothetical protein
MPAPTVMADLGGLLKNVYADVRKDVFPVITPLLAQVQKSTPGGRLQWGGNGVFWDVKTTRDVGLVSSSIGAFPADAVATEVQASMGVQRLYVYREIDGLAITGTQSQEAAYLSVVRKAMDSIKVAIKLGMQEQLHGDANCIKALVNTVTDTTHITATNGYGLGTVGTGSVVQAGLLLDVGMAVAVLNPSGPAVRGYSTISALTNSGDTATITLASAISSMAQGDYIVPATSATDNSFSKGINGLLNITNRGNAYAALHGVTAARWDAVRMVAGTDTPDATQPNEIDVQRLLTRIYQRCGVNPTEKPGEFLLITTPSLKIKLAESFLGQRQYQMGTMDLNGGFKGINVAGLALIDDPFCPAGTIYCVRTADLTWVDAKDWGQVQYGSDNAWRPIAGFDRFGTGFGAYLNFGALARNSHGSITGYTDSERITFVV